MGGTEADTVRVAAHPQHWSDQPRFVMARSLIVPGWGQFYNHAWIKGVAVAGTETWFIVTLVQDKNALDDLQSEIDDARNDGDKPRYADAVSRYNDRLDTFVAHQWLFGAVLAYALIDAYVDAHFRNFDIEFRHDPALPDDLPGDPPSKGGGPARGAGTRVALRWHF